MNHQLGTLTNSNFVSLSYSNSIQTKNLDLTEGVLGQGTLSIELHNSISGTYLYKVDNEVIGNFTVKSCVKSGDTYKATLYDYVGMLNETQRKDNTTAGTFGYATHSSTNGITHGTYASSSSATLTEADYFTADIGLVTSQPYYAITVHMPERHGLWLGKKFTLEGYTGYVQSISWDIDTYTISCQVEEADNTESQIEQVESQIIQQGGLITALTVETGLIEAKVERKNAVYRQSTEPADTEGTGEDTKYDLLNTGDIWYYTGTTTTTYTNGKWYACTATGTHEGGDRAITWTETTDVQITNNSSRLTVAEGQIQSKVSQLTYNNDINAAGGLKERMTSAETSITQTAEQLTLKASKTEAQGYASTAEDNAKGYADDVGDTAEGNAKNYTDGVKTTLEAAINVNASNISAEVTRATNAENGKINATGEMVKTGMGWNLTADDWTVNKISGSTKTPVMTVNSTGLTVNGTINADSGYIGNLKLEQGTIKARTQNAEIDLRTEDTVPVGVDIKPGSICVYDWKSQTKMDTTIINYEGVKSDRLKTTNTGKIVLPGPVQYGTGPLSGETGEEGEVRFYYT